MNNSSCCATASRARRAENRFSILLSRELFFSKIRVAETIKAESAFLLRI
jgi:hypothetical protein